MLLSNLLSLVFIVKCYSKSLLLRIILIIIIIIVIIIIIIIITSWTNEIRKLTALSAAQTDSQGYIIGAWFHKFKKKKTTQKHT